MSTIPNNPSVNPSPAGPGPQQPLAPGSNTFSPIPPGTIPVTIRQLPVLTIGQQVIPGDSPSIADASGDSNIL